MLMGRYSDVRKEASTNRNAVSSWNRNLLQYLVKISQKEFVTHFPWQKLRESCLYHDVCTELRNKFQESTAYGLVKQTE